VVFDRFGGVISWSLGEVAGNGVVLDLYVKVWGNMRGGVVLRCLGGVTRGRVILCIFGVWGIISYGLYSGELVGK
jgi:hypothetical protein